MLLRAVEAHRALCRSHLEQCFPVRGGVGTSSIDDVVLVFLPNMKHD